MLRTTIRLKPQRHWTPAYVRDRVSLAFYEYRNPGVPWLTAAMVNFLNSWLRPSDVGLEWGSGASTRWFAARTAHLTSIEYDESWFNKVKAELAESGSSCHVDYLFYSKDDRAYFECVDRLPDESLDFCLVDGEFRDECVRRSIRKVKKEGLLIVDNINRYIPHSPRSSAPHSIKGDNFASELWQEVGAQLSSWRCIWTTNGVTDTAAWVKPCR